MRHGTWRVLFAATSAIALVGLGPIGSRAETATQTAKKDAAALASPAVQRITVTGTIEAVEKNLFGRAKRVQIVSTRQGPYLVEDIGKGEELKDHVGERVTVTARLKTNDEGREVLTVERYELSSS